MPMDLHFEKSADFTLQKALSLEWLETNGLGGYSSSTIINSHTRKYHGLLVSHLENPPGKFVLLSKLDEFISYENLKHSLTAHQFKNNLQSSCFASLAKFYQKTHPTFVFQFGDIILSKEIILLHEEDTVLIKYKLLSGEKTSYLKLILKPLLAYRDFHALTKENIFINAEMADCTRGKKITPYQGMPTLFMHIDGAFEFASQPVWYKDFIYEWEEKRGFASIEDLFAPGVFTLHFNSEKEIIFSASLKENTCIDLKSRWYAEISRRLKLLKKNKGAAFQRQLQTILPTFLQKDLSKQQLSIVAGYHWFTAWGRDTMLTLPALIQSGWEKESLAILIHLSKHEKNGLIPNFLGYGHEDNAYNTVDASLWFAWAVQHYYQKTKDIKAIAIHLWPTLKSIYDNYKKGTLYDIKMGEEGLIYAGSNDLKLNLTWMDAMVDGQSVVQRNGLQVEVNALWYNMLHFMEFLADKLNESIGYELKYLHEKVKASFRDAFWNEDLGYLRDFINPTNPNTAECNALRPNQIIAVSLPYSPLTPKKMEKVVQTVRINLLTPYGLRSLAPKDKNYIGSYCGCPSERDRAYHNGAVWPWLLGHFAEALVKVLQNKKAAIKILKPCFDALNRHLHDAGIGTISEIFSGDAPHSPDGCISQAWSVAEVLRTAYLIY